MSGAGFNPLAIVAPDLYAKQLGIQQRQALAQALMEQGSAPTNATRFNGLANAGKEMLGAFLAKGANQDMAGLYAPQPSSDVGQVSNAPMPAPPASAAPAPMPQGQRLGAALQGNLPSNPSAPTDPAAIAQQQAQQPAQPGAAPKTIPDAMAQAIPDLPGLTHTQSMIEFFQAPQQYWQALAPTPEYRNALMAAGGNEAAAKQLLMGAAQKNSTINLRPGGAAVDYASGNVLTLPNANGLQTTFPNGVNGGAQMSLAPGAGGALAQSGYASQVPKAMLTPHVGYDVNGQPQASNDLAMSGNTPAASLVAPSLGALQPGDLAPEIPAQQKPFLAGQGDAAEKRFNGTVNEAEGSPDRQNVLNNIIQLSESGVRTGPGSDFIAHLNGVAGTLFPNSKFSDAASQYQELTKFAYQNAIRAWQVAGGTGTDNQMAVQMQANVNTHMNPQALQDIAKWALAGENAVMAKANAQQMWMSQHGNTPTAQTGFENAWRNAMDRRVYILKGMPPQEQTAYINRLPPSEARKLLQKRQQLRALGAL